MYQYMLHHFHVLVMWPRITQWSVSCVGGARHLSAYCLMTLEKNPFHESCKTLSDNHWRLSMPCWNCTHHHNTTMKCSWKQHALIQSYPTAMATYYVYLQVSLGLLSVSSVTSTTCSQVDRLCAFLIKFQFCSSLLPCHLPSSCSEYTVTLPNKSPLLVNTSLYTLWGGHQETGNFWEHSWSGKQGGELTASSQGEGGGGEV